MNNAIERLPAGHRTELKFENLCFWSAKGIFSVRRELPQKRLCERSEAIQSRHLGLQGKARTKELNRFGERMPREDAKDAVKPLMQPFIKLLHWKQTYSSFARIFLLKTEKKRIAVAILFLLKRVREV